MKHYATTSEDDFYIDDSVNYFFHCYYNKEIVDDFHVSAGTLPITMRQIAVKNSQSARNVRLIDTLADGFSFDSEIQDDFSITLRYYENSEIFEEKIDTKDRIFIGKNTITAFVGNLWDEQTAAILSKSSQDKFYFEAKLSFGITADFSELPKDTWVKTNEEAYFLYNYKQKSLAYISPEIYIPSDTPPTPPIPPTPPPIPPTPIPPIPPAPVPPDPNPPFFPPATSNNTLQAYSLFFCAFACFGYLFFLLFYWCFKKSK